MWTETYLSDDKEGKTCCSTIREDKFGRRREKERWGNSEEGGEVEEETKKEEEELRVWSKKEEMR